MTKGEDNLVSESDNLVSESDNLVSESDNLVLELDNLVVFGEGFRIEGLWTGMVFLVLLVFLLRQAQHNIFWFEGWNTD